jgi:hypothetical protein
MKIYHCYGKVEGSKYLGDVRAKNAIEALAKARELDEICISFCHQCAGDCEDPMVTKIFVEDETGEDEMEEIC